MVIGGLPKTPESWVSGSRRRAITGSGFLPGRGQRLSLLFFSDLLLVGGFWVVVLVDLGWPEISVASGLPTPGFLAPDEFSGRRRLAGIFLSCSSLLRNCRIGG